MRKLCGLLDGVEELERVLAAIEGGRCPAAVSGLSPVHRAHFAAAVAARTGRSVVLLCAGEEEADGLAADLHALTGREVIRIYPREFAFYDGAASHDWEHRRLSAFRAMGAGEALAVVCTIEALLSRTIPPALLEKASFTLSAREAMPLEKAVEGLVRAGYSRTEQVEGVGQFALRGGILDFFSPAYDRPVRVEYWGDDIDSMGLFDPMTQRRTETLEEAAVLPAAEVIAPLGDGPELPSSDRYLPQIYREVATAADYLPADGVIFWSESGRVRERGEHYLWGLQEDVKALIEKELIPGDTGVYARTVEELAARLMDWPTVYLDSFAASRYPVPPRTLLSVMAKQLPSFGASLETAVSDLSHYIREEYAVTVLVHSEQRALNLQTLLREQKVRSAVDFSLHELPRPGQIVIAVGGLSAGFEYPETRRAVLTQGNAAPVKRKRRHAAQATNRQKLAS